MPCLGLGRDSHSEIILQLHEITSCLQGMMPSMPQMMPGMGMPMGM